MTFKNLRDTFDAPVLRLPIGDDTIEVDEASADAFRQLIAFSARPAGEDPPPDAVICPLVLGPDLYERLQKTLPPSQLQVVFTTAYLWQLRNPAAAEEFWNSGGKALGGRKPTPTRTRRATRTGGATTTRRRASGTGTSTRRKSSGPATA